MSTEMTPARFVAKWSRAELSERAASQEHFLDLCRLLGQPTPAEHDATGAEYTFEKGVSVLGGASRGSRGEHGFADVWWKGKFAWEYKRKGKYRDLAGAYRQLCQYREALENPPLLVVSDIARTEIHTNFTGTAKRVHAVELEHLVDAGSLDLLRRVFTDPDSFRPDTTAVAVTEAAAEQFGRLARALRDRGHEPHDAAHFLMRCMFCLFAEDVNLLPEKLFTRLLASRRNQPQTLTGVLSNLFQQMQTGGIFGVDDIPYFNGGLFDGSSALPLERGEIDVMLAAAEQDWGSVEPAIFGTLFERSLDPNTRAQIGAHYTSRDDILLVVEPVVMAPLRREWAGVRAEVEKQLERRRTVRTKDTRAKADKAIAKAIEGFLDRLASVRILDPACGSGNFLYVAIQQLLDLEKEVITFAARPDISLGLFPGVRPTQLHGIEINPYAAELAQVVIWIGYLQWMRDNGFIAPREPILEPMRTIECRDAILAWVNRKGEPIDVWEEGATCLGAAGWPEADFIIGNPPFLGSKLFRQQGLEDEYIAAMFEHFDLPKTSDLCCYWFELARRVIERHDSTRAGLLATQGIRGGSNRTVLERIKKTGDIFMAWADREWILEGAAVHVSIVGFDSGIDDHKTLNGRPVVTVNANLTCETDTTTARILPENTNLSFIGGMKKGKFDIDWQTARQMLTQSGNPNGRSNRDVLTPWVNGLDVTRRLRSEWIIDFGSELNSQQAALYERPFEYIRRTVKPERDKVRASFERERWWLHARPVPDVRLHLTRLTRYLATARVAKHRLFVFLEPRMLPDGQLVVFARCDDYFFGVLHSSIHELWARRQGTQLREAESGFRYTPTTCFETFPLPWAPGREPIQNRDCQGAAAQGDDSHGGVVRASEVVPHPPLPDGRGSESPPAGRRCDGESPPAGRRCHTESASAAGEAYARISEAARELNEQRERWLNPPEWIGPIAAAVDAEDRFEDVPAEARPLIRQSAIMARAAADARLKKRTLTNLYNERPTWLRLAHERLDRAVLAAYAAVDPDGGWEEDWAAVWTETGAGQPLPDGHALSADRERIEQQVLGNLLRMNLERAGER